MSNIIKSFRVVDAKIMSKKETKKDSQLEEMFIEEAREKHDEILLKAEEEALRIINAAHSQSEEKLNQSYERAKDIFKDAEIKGYDEGYRLGKNKGYEEGYKTGYDEGKEESEKLIAEALDIKKQYIDKQSSLMKDVEKDLIDLVISIYEKVLYKKVDEDKEMIVNLVLNGIDNLEISEKLTIIVSKDDYETVKTYKDKILAKASLIDELDIRANIDMDKGDCILETSKGSVDVSFNKQLKEVRELIMTILNNE